MQALTFSHIPVLLSKVQDYLPALGQDTLLIDATFGGGGYTAAFLSAGYRVIAVDKDKQAIKRGQNIFPQIKFINSSYAELTDQLLLLGVQAVDGVIFDLGVSSPQIDDALRGFSWKNKAAPLDMRMDQSRGITAAEILNTFTEAQLSKIIRDYGEEPRAMAMAREIIRRRPLSLSNDLYDVVHKVYKQQFTLQQVARVFQALRIAVNNELEELAQGLEQAFTLLKPGGRIIAVSFHSLEDRIVKNFFKDKALGCTCPPIFPKCVCGHKPELRILTKKPICAEAEEQKDNIRARSAKMRAGEKL